MNSLKGIAKAFFIGVMTLLMLSSTAIASEKPLEGKNLVVFVSASDVNKAGMGMTIGMAASAQAGANVTIVVGAGATQYILKDGKNSYFKPMDKSIQAVLKNAIASGTNVYLCGMCAKSLGLKNSDLISGAKIVEGADIFAKIYAKDARVISF
ncbi:MAG: DsrE family protein [Epsilonproteobacteria bacterium]|nr:DsrE family protein [Campylobacterota bacterium]